MRVVEQLRKDVKEAKDRENKLRCLLASRDSEKVSGAEKLREYEVAFDAMAQREAAMKSKVADMRKQVAGPERHQFSPESYRRTKHLHGLGDID